MSLIKRWLEDHIAEFTDEELLAFGYDQEDIDFMRECFTEREGAIAAFLSQKIQPL